MLNRILVVVGILLVQNICFAQEVVLTPVNKFTTSSKYVRAGDDVEFKLLNDYKNIPKDSVIRGTILDYSENGFYLTHAEVTFGNFRTSDNKIIKGKLYVSGDDRANEASKTNIAAFCFGGYARGAEINLVPGVSILKFVVED